MSVSIVHNQDLIDELSKAFYGVKKRIWIAVPFIGSWKYVQRIMGTKWMTQENIEFKLITDIRNENFLSLDSFKIFQKFAEIKSLEGLHAKVYIVED